MYCYRILKYGESNALAILQWKYVQSNSDEWNETNATITYPIAFSSGSFIAMAHGLGSRFAFVTSFGGTSLHAAGANFNWSTTASGIFQQKCSMTVIVIGK
jgi:hypothetical protein